MLLHRPKIHTDDIAAVSWGTCISNTGIVFRYSPDYEYTGWLCPKNAIQVSQEKCLQIIAEMHNVQTNRYYPAKETVRLEKRLRRLNCEG